MLKEISQTRSQNERTRIIILFLINLLISTFLIKLLWNKSLVKHVSTLRKVDTLLEAFILSIALSVVRGL
jgi:hypothetical protein|tara:strand:- start:1385 stop:1594 length:210 start_codon:yes stop_codon:yes gene_type:complete